MKRRTFLTGALLGGAAVATSLVVSAPRRRGGKRPPKGLTVFSAEDALTLSAVAARMVAPLDAEKLGIARKLDALMAAADDLTQHDLKQLLALLDNPLASLALDGRWTRFTDLSPDAQDRALADWRDSRIPDRRSGFQALQRLCLAIAYADPTVAAGIGYPGPPVLVRADGSTVGGPDEGTP